TNNLTEQLNGYCQKIMSACETNEVFLTHINHHEGAHELYETLIDANPNGVNIHFRDASPIMGVYTGPKSIAISYVGDWDKSWIK
ncbi:MAG: DegV family protein, partial [Candidatus Heimdallarchaeota archaeon]